MYRLTKVLMAVALAGQYGCASGSPTDSGREALELRISTPTEARMAQPLPVDLIVRNTGAQVVTQSFGGFAERVQFNVVVTRPDGSEVWSLLHGQASSLIATQKTIGPGEELTLSAVWPLRDNSGAPVPAGRYVIRGRVYAAPDDLVSPEVTVQVAP